MTPINKPDQPKTENKTTETTLAPPLLDIHNHIIHDVDDGSTDIESSLRLVDLAYQEGIRGMIATPHIGPLNPQYDRGRVERNYHQLVERVALAHPDMKLYPGNEIFLAPGYPDGLKDGIACSLAGSSYVLIEFPGESSYDYISHECRRLLMEGYIPILAHVERYQHIYRKISMLEYLVRQGAKVQVNSKTICDMDKKTKVLERFLDPHKGRFVQNILQEGLVHFVATDCHDMPGRLPVMRDAIKKISDFLGEESVRRIFYDNPHEIISQLMN